MTDLNTRTPPGDDVTQRMTMKPAFSENLLEQVLLPENLQVAWKRVRANKGAAGIDGMTIDDFPAWVRSGKWKEVLKELETGHYYPSPVRRVEIDKPDGGKRQLGLFETIGNRHRPSDSTSNNPSTNAHFRSRLLEQ